VEVSPSPNGNVCDKLSVSGTLTLGGATLDIGALSGDGCTILTNAVNIVGQFDGLTNGAALPPPNVGYYIHFSDNGAANHITINKNPSPTAAEAIIRAYATADGVIVEFQSTEGSGQNDIVLSLYRNGRWMEVGRQPAAGGGSHTYRFVVPGLRAGDIANLMVRDDEGQYHTANDLTVGKFAARVTQLDNTGLTLQWESIPGRTYDIYRAGQAHGTWEPVQAIEAVQTQTVTFVTFDPAAVGFFKVGMRE
jgi:hypothetical protein